ncbi:t-SNARE [Pleomassaria siparia CBS 279.74]|uniref:t-SNARE n=1 Tax=Pleomassaria siparia CBS 279.74 TaxID=1314801 RepID=A0A6G1KAN2_9PLEO|nr:t-SNARE [Pleomassaria siparia CBS 279.74]
MSGGYQQYGGNPYSQEGGTSGANPYGGTTGYGTTNPYGGVQQQHQQQQQQQQQQDDYQHNAPPPAHDDPAYSQPSQYSAPAPIPAHQATPLSRDDFLQRIEGAKGRINQLASQITEIEGIHQRMLSSPDNRASAQLESIVSETQVRNTSIKDEIKFLEKDASREPSNSFKRSQVDALKRSFTAQLRDFEQAEAAYSKRYREAIARQYRIVNPEATEAEVNEAANADWGNEGIFQQALKTNRSGQASSVLGAVRARHNDIQRIEQTLGELAQLFTQLNEVVVYQEVPVTQIEQGTTNVKDDTERANTQLDAGIKSARRRRRLQWWTLGVFVLILCIIALALGIYFGTGKNKKNNA